ncbi:MAG: tetratricopeptide repeat protein [Methylobacter sp.]|nr:MAG: tetratricopeptide repeat protein [Methylobacter sp.]
MSTDNTVRMFWHGSMLSAYETLSITSFLKQGHRVEVFSYGELNLPAGAVLVDAGSVLPANEIFMYQSGPGKGSVAAYADIFRYKLLYERGGIWSDSDVLCLRSMNSLPPVCVGREDDKTVSIGVMRFPPGHPLIGELYEQAVSLGKNVGWAQAGPQLITKLLPNYPDVVVLPSPVFYPIHWREAWRLVTAEEYDHCVNAASESYAVHWWNEIFRRIGIPKDKLPPTGSYIERCAASVLDGEWDVWSSAAVANWVDNFLSVGLAMPVKRYNDGLYKLADMLRDLGAERLNGGHWQQAVELLSAAHHIRPGGSYIRLLLAVALIELGMRQEAYVHLRAALDDPSTSVRAHEIELQYGLFDSMTNIE